MDRGAWQATVHGITKSQTHVSMHMTQIGSTHLFQFFPLISASVHLIYGDAPMSGA